jgi:enoyl-CoA hydratase/carnithine racemase
VSETIRTTLEAGVIEVMIVRPAKKNALTAALYQGLADAMKRADEDPAARVVLIHGQADVFTSGNDISDFIERPPNGMRDPVFQFLQRICNTAKPLVAAVNGPAVGIGTTMLLHCDYVVAGEGAYFAVPFVNLGLCPEAGSSLLFPANLGYKRAAEMLLFGERLPAAQALDWGLVNKVVPDARVLEIARERARTLAAKPTEALRSTKALLKRTLAPAAAERMVEEGKEFHRLLHAPAAREALAAFVEKRKPDPAKVL